MNKGMEKKVYRILALNFGSTSSKLAYFENDVCSCLLYTSPSPRDCS